MTLDYATGAMQGATTTLAPPAAAAPGRIYEARSGRGMEALLALRADWDALCASRRDAGFHHSHAWHMSYLRNLEQDWHSIHFFSFFRDGRPAAIFPLRLARRRGSARSPLALWELPFHPHMNLCDALIAPHEDGGALLRQLVQALQQRKGLPWDALHLPNLRDDAAVLQALRAYPLPRILLLRAGSSMSFPCGDLASAMRGCTTRFKRNLRRQRKKLEQLGRVETAIVRDRPGLEDAFQAFLRIEASGWKGRDGRGSAIMLHPDLVGFYRELMEDFADGRRCLINLLKLDGVVIAAQFALAAGRTLHLLKIAYDERFAAAAPGNQLLHDVLRHCCDSGDFERLSLVTGPAWAAGRWNPDSRQVWDAYVFNSTVRGMCAYAAMWTRLAAATAVKALAD